MKAGYFAAAAGAAAVIAFSVYMADVETAGDRPLPGIDVSVERENDPEFNVATPDVDGRRAGNN